MFVLKNGHAPELNGANCHAKLSHSKQLLKIIHPVCQLTIRYLQWSHWRTQRITNCTQLQQPERKTSRQNAYAHNWHVDSHWWH